MITLAKYAQDGSVTAIIDDQEIFNITEGNWRWTQVQEWVKAGNTIAPYTTPAAAPLTIQMWQARAALRRSGLLDQSDAAVNASGNGDLIEYWEYATVLDEGNAMVKTLATTIGITTKKMHDLFVSAADIKL